MAARVDPLHASARHQSLHHFVAKALWSDRQLLNRVAQWVVPLMDFGAGGWWIIDDTGFPKKGTHSVGVTRQYCGVLGKQDNCQVAVSVSLACEEGSLPVAWQLYLPHAWTEDTARRLKAGIPEDIGFATKPQIAMQQLRSLLSEGAPHHCVLADAGLWNRLCVSSRAERSGPGLHGRHHLCGRRLGARGRAAAAQTLQRHGPPAGYAATYHSNASP